MKQYRFSKRTVYILAFLLAFCSLIAILLSASPLQAIADVTDGVPDADPAASVSHRLIVQLQSPSLTEKRGSLADVRLESHRLDLNAPDVAAYVGQLKAEQAAFIQAMGQALPEASVSTFINESGVEEEATYQVVFNGVAVDPGATDRQQAIRTLQALPGVKAVYADYAHEPELYASLPLINAPSMWSQLGGRSDAGSGVMVASMDGGLHHAAPMFDGTGWSYPPGWPAGGLGDDANNNGKIIASRAYFRTWDPPAQGDENTWPGENGTSHGNHTGSIAAGDVVSATYAGANVGTISGVAPGSWLMSYRVFYASVNGIGSFFTAEGIAALEDIVMDGADVLNNSWGGGPSSAGGPFDPLDQALINAADSGIFVSMSAGNAGPGNGTTDHPSPDYINVAASTTSGTFASGRLSVSAPEPVSPTLKDMPYGIATFGPPLPVGAVFTHTFVTAESVDSTNFEGCDPWTGTPFSGHAVLISRGSCEFGVKVLNAENGGAEFVVIYNNAGDGLTNMGPGAVGDQVAISSIFIGQTNGEDMVAWYDMNGSASALEVNTIAFQLGNEPDVIADFSSRGPGAGNVLKPDIAAPGVNIVAQGFDPTATGEARHLGFGQVSGTSMAAPHVAGAAALLREAHPDWSNAYIKSALMSTAKYMDIYNGDGSPAQPLDMGAGRLDLTNAADPGVILSPPSISFGEMVTGTQASFQVDVTSVAAASQTYSTTTLYTGAGFLITQTTTLPGISVSPAQLTLAPGETGVVTVTFDTAASMGIGDNQGYILLTSPDYEAHMPVWARVTPPPAADILVIDNDFSYLLGYPDYRAYYTDALDDLGLSYDVWHADAHFGGPTSIPEAAILSAYDAIIYYTGDNFYPDGSFTVSTPLTSLDMDRLTEYANGGGTIIAMGQDLSGVTADSFFLGYVLGGDRLQDSVTGGALPSDPVAPYADAPPAFHDVLLDLSGWRSETVALTGANEVPPVATTVQGDATSTYDVANNELYFEINLQVSSPISITASHIHTGTAGVNGPVIHPIFPFTSTQYVTDTLSWDGSVTLTDDEEAALFNQGLYYNVHSSDHPGGEVRAQVVAAVVGDGAGNQNWMDELVPDPGAEPDPIPGDSNPFQALFAYPTGQTIDEGVVAMAHRDQPTLEQPGIDYFGRSIFTAFGLEGVNDGLGGTSRADLLARLLAWANDEPFVAIADVSTQYDPTSPVTILQATLTSNISGTTGISYRWDFGDGTPFAGPYNEQNYPGEDWDFNMASHQYAVCGTYTVRVEAKDSWGNVAIGQEEVEVANGCQYQLLAPVLAFYGQ